MRIAKEGKDEMKGELRRKVERRAVTREEVGRREVRGEGRRLS
jgi:hypothetical protein